MKVVAKLALLFVAASCIVLAGFGYFSARAEVQRARRAQVAEAEQLGEVVARAIRIASEVAGDDAAKQILDTFEADRHDLDLAWSPTAVARAPFEPSEGRVSLSFPIGAEAQQRGYVTISLRVPTEGDIMAEQLPAELLTALLLAITGGLLSVVVGAWVVGGPLERVVAQARRIGAGDFTGRLRDDGSDEIGALKRELNAMCELLDQARKRVEDETAAKTATLEQLRHLDRLRTVGTLASAVAHELGTPLNVVLIHAQAMLAGPEPSETTEAGEAIVRQVERMSLTVRSLLDFARQSPPAKDRVRLADVASGAASLVLPLARRSGISLDVEVDDDCHVPGDAIQLEQALTNFIVNAIHATSSGGRIVVRVGVRADVAPPDSSRTLDAGIVEVSDSGHGMEADELARIFEPFYTTKARGSGTGLGLGVARGIAADHGGWISATSTRGAGSTFTLWIPLAS